MNHIIANEQALMDARDAMEDARDLLDEVDGTPLGQVGAKLDRVAAAVTSAHRQIDDLLDRAAVGRAVA